MHPPTIGITVDQHDSAGHYELSIAYATAVEKAGGLPILLPYKTDLSLIPRYLDIIDGMLFPGGNDLDPALYGQQWHPKVSPIDPARQQFELALLSEAQRRQTPTLGVCLGLQLMNVHRGGSLHQFLPDLDRPQAQEHRRLEAELRRHPVTLELDSRLGRAIGHSPLSVNTYHKQGVDRLGDGLRAVAWAPDGIVEGLEDPSLPLWVAVQWHPERLPDEPEHLSIFRLLVDAAR